MKPETDKMICLALGMDETITPRHAQEVLSVLRGTATKVENPIEDKIVTRDEAADMLRVTPVTVSNWGRRGIIRRVTLQGRGKALGFSLLSIREIIEGRREMSKNKGA